MAAVSHPGVELTVVGCERSPSGDAENLVSRVNYVRVPIAPNRKLSSIFSQLPKDAYVLAVGHLREQVSKLLEARWDWIVIDHANSAGVLSEILRFRSSSALCYVAHNAEGPTRLAVSRSGYSNFLRPALRYDAQKYAALERRTISCVDLILSITPQDAEYFRRFHSNVVVVPPIYLGRKTSSRTISASTPKAILLIGTFDWIAKRGNLEEVAHHLAPVLAQAGIDLKVIGTVPDRVKERLTKVASNLHFLGRVPDPTEVMNACRGGLVAEILGGGFKLKILDYAFNRLPIFGLRAALSGLSAQEIDAAFVADDLEGLGSLIVSNIDRFDLLNISQKELYGLVDSRFSLATAVGRMRSALTLR